MAAANRYDGWVAKGERLRLLSKPWGFLFCLRDTDFRMTGSKLPFCSNFFNGNFVLMKTDRSNI
jgi:hypothetical protein